MKYLRACAFAVASLAGVLSAPAHAFEKGPTQGWGKDVAFKVVNISAKADIKSLAMQAANFPGGFWWTPEAAEQLRAIIDGRGVGLQNAAVGAVDGSKGFWWTPEAAEQYRAIIDGRGVGLQNAALSFKALP